MQAQGHYGGTGTGKREEKIWRDGVTIRVLREGDRDEGRKSIKINLSENTKVNSNAVCLGQAQWYKTIS